jgi:hypothetical protein
MVASTVVGFVGTVAKSFLHVGSGPGVVELLAKDLPVILLVSTMATPWGAVFLPGGVVMALHSPPTDLHVKI